MRSLALLFAMALWVGPGCFVLDELDDGMAKMKEVSPSARKQAEAAAEAELAAARKPKGKPLDLARWWKSARTPTSGPKEPGTAMEVVTCHIGGEVRFMAKTDCEVQGGRF